MFVVLFEVEPFADLWERYLDVAAMLRPELEGIDGFIDNTRFTSARTPGRLLSLSTWRDEKSLIRWRTHAVHHEQGQRPGRSEIFRDYRLRVAQVTADTHPPGGRTVQQTRYDETEVGDAKAVTILEPGDADRDDDGPPLPELPAVPALLDVERYDAILAPHTPVLLASWTTAAAAAAIAYPATVRVRHVRVIREYGLHERREAPQYFPAAPRG